VKEIAPLGKERGNQVEKECDLTLGHPGLSLSV
jgi:hypothetical protein